MVHESDMEAKAQLKEREAIQGGLASFGDAPSVTGCIQYLFFELIVMSVPHFYCSLLCSSWVTHPPIVLVMDVLQ